jgi:hypothetical protein
MPGRRSAFVGIFLAATVFGCTSNNSSGNSSSNNSREISESQIPTAVQAAFFSEHPYATINHPHQLSDQNGNDTYLLPYTLSGGATGSATYSESGTLLNGQ